MTTISVTSYMGHWNTARAPSSIFNIFSVHYGRAQSLTATLCGHLSSSSSSFILLKQNSTNVDNAWQTEQGRKARMHFHLPLKIYFTVCVSSCSMVVATWMHFVSLLCDEVFLGRVLSRWRRHWWPHWIVVRKSTSVGPIEPVQARVLT